MVEVFWFSEEKGVFEEKRKFLKKREVFEEKGNF
jgi:hypothetical protein